MRGIGKGVREFNDAKEHVKSEIEAGMKEKDTDKKEIVNNTTTPTPEVTPTAVSASSSNTQNQ